MIILYLVGKNSKTKKVGGADMKAVILAGGLGTRLSEETEKIPKPMVEIGSKPILWHIMKIFSTYGVNEFIICLGYRGNQIKDYFHNYRNLNSNFTIDLDKGSVRHDKVVTEPWSVSLVDTGENTMTGGRIKRVRNYLTPGEPFFLTYGDGVGNIDIERLKQTHLENKTMATVTAVRPPARFGALTINGNKVTKFAEKPEGDLSWINGGFFVLDPMAVDLIEGDQTTWEDTPLLTLASQNQLGVYKHDSFWHPMDTLRDKRILEKAWLDDNPPWKVW